MFSPAPAASPLTYGLVKSFWLAAGGHEDALAQVTFSGQGDLPSVFEVTSFASASIAAAGLAVASLMKTMETGEALPAAVVVDRRLASFWFGLSVRPQGWCLPPVWDAVAGDYRAADGWIRLHTNAPQHREAALAVLQVPAERAAVAQAVAHWHSDALEAAVVARGGCAGAMRSWQQWQQHPQGRAVLAEPLLHWQEGSSAATPGWAFRREPCRAAPKRLAPQPAGRSYTSERPLAGVRVLDMTRVLAGPVATRLLASLGAEVLRIDPPGWDEPVLTPEVTVGKQCARLDLRQADQRATWETLLAGADVLVHGYRGDALESLGLGTAQRQQLRPGLVDVSLDAYGFSGPWRGRRGFDSIVQMSMGFAEAGQRSAGADKPVPLPVQALDHATGYLMASAVVRALERRITTGRGSIARASLARTGALLMAAQCDPQHARVPLLPESQDDWSADTEQTEWGPARLLRWPLQVEGVVFAWSSPAVSLGSSAAAWQRSADNR